MTSKKISSKVRKYVHEQHPTIGLLTDNLTSDFVTQLLLGTADAIQQYGANLICFPGGALSDATVGLQRNVLYELVSEQNVDGVLLMANFVGTTISREQLISWMHNVLPDVPT